MGYIRENEASRSFAKPQIFLSLAKGEVGYKTLKHTHKKKKKKKIKKKNKKKKKNIGAG